MLSLMFSCFPALVPTPAHGRSAIALRAAQPTAIAAPAPVVVFGPGSLDVRLITAKLAARAGFATSIIAGAGAENQWRRFLGEEASDDIALVSSPEDIGAALAEAAALCIVCDESPLPEETMVSALEAAPKLERVVLLSKHGVTRAQGGPFDRLTGGLFALKEGEEALAKALGEKELSIVRVGTLKGGGPGRVEGGVVVSGVELGLAKTYYDSILELETALVTQAYDKFTLGAKCARGDPIDPPNPVIKLANRGSFEPRDDETSRIVACAAAVQALRHPTALELSVSAAKGEAPPTSGQWEAIFNQL